MTVSQFLMSILFPSSALVMGLVMYRWFMPKRPESR